MECGDQVLRNFLNALVIPLAGKENQKIKWCFSETQAQIPVKELRKGVKSKTKGEEEKDQEREVLQNRNLLLKKKPFKNNSQGTPKFRL
jgi:uncharacterized protein YehS (DUF1456 family)